MCTVHSINIHAYNIPTVSKHNPKHQKRVPCKYTCWKENDWVSGMCSCLKEEDLLTNVFNLALAEDGME